ncbi:DUF982 domain-containing protein [Cereibacter sp. SYSU M97828]|nr:DUF982 domain-containing protein [Cereibacter flavus]
MWSKPLTFINPSTKLHATARTSREALKILNEYWWMSDGAAYAAAVETCLAELHGDAGAHEARIAFSLALNEMGMSLLADATNEAA